MQFFILSFIQNCFLAEANENLEIKDLQWPESGTENDSTNNTQKIELKIRKDGESNSPCRVLMLTPVDSHNKNESDVTNSTNREIVLLELASSCKFKWTPLSQATNQKTSKNHHNLANTQHYESISPNENAGDSALYNSEPNTCFENGSSKKTTDIINFQFNYLKETTLNGLDLAFKNVNRKIHESLRTNDYYVDFNMEEIYLIINRGLPVVNYKILGAFCSNLIRKDFLQELLSFHLRIYLLNFEKYIYETRINTLECAIADLKDENGLIVLKEELEALHSEILQQVSTEGNEIKKSLLHEISDLYPNLMFCFKSCVDKCLVEFHSRDKLVLRAFSSIKPRFLVKLQCDEMNISVLYGLFKHRLLVFQPYVDIDLIKLAVITNTSCYDLIPSLIDLFARGNGLTDVYLQSLMSFWARSLYKIENIYCPRELKNTENSGTNVNTNSIFSHFKSNLKWMSDVLLSRHVLKHRHFEYYFSLSMKIYRKISKLASQGFRTILNFITLKNWGKYQKPNTQGEEWISDSSEDTLSLISESISYESSEADIFYNLQNYLSACDRKLSSNEMSTRLDTKSYELISKDISNSIVRNGLKCQMSWFLFGTLPNMDYNLPKSHLHVLFFDDLFFIARTRDKFEQFHDIILPDSSWLSSRSIFIRAKSLNINFYNLLKISPHHIPQRPSFLYTNQSITIKNLSCQILRPLIDFNCLFCENVRFGTEKIVLRGQYVSLSRCTATKSIFLSGDVRHMKISRFTNSYITIDDMFLEFESFHLQKSFGPMKLHEIVLSCCDSKSIICYFKIEENIGHIFGYNVSGSLSWPQRTNRIIIESCLLDRLLIKDYIHLEIRNCIGSIVYSEYGMLFLGRKSRLVLKSDGEPIFENLVSYQEPLSFSEKIDTRRAEFD